MKLFHVIKNDEFSDKIIKLVPLSFTFRSEIMEDHLCHRLKKKKICLTNAESAFIF